MPSVYTKVLDEQRKRTRRACKSCHGRKVKCDGRAPCSGCKKRGHDCYYDPLRKPKRVTHIPMNEATLRVPNPDTMNLHVGDSSSSSFLAEIKSLVLLMSSPCPFTEGHVNLSWMGSHSRSQALTGEVPLPSQDIAEHLVKRAHQYSNHFVEILDESTIQELLCFSYSNLSSQEPGSRCLLYLLFATGSLAVEPQKSTKYPHLSPPKPLQQADEYFKVAEATLRIGSYETFEVWMVQAWALMTTYCLATSKQNAADVYIGLAVRAADVLGINHAPGSSSCAPSEVDTNSSLYAKLRNCLFVLNCFVAALLGRQPQALKEESELALAAATYCTPPIPNGRDDCLAFNVASANIIHRTIELVYNQRHLSAERASSILQQAQLYAQPTPVCSQGQDGADTLATQQAILFRNYAVILLTRPFFVQELYHLSNTKHDTIWTYLSTTCVITAHEYVERIYEAYIQSREFRNNYMWRPCLYKAVLVILTNQFFGYYQFPNSGLLIKQAFTILHYWTAQSPTEEGELNSLSSLRCLVDEQIARRFGRPVYVDMGPYGGAAVGYDVSRADRANGGVGHCYSAAPDCMDSTPVGATGIAQLGAWSAHDSLGVSPTHYGSEAGCDGFTMKQDGCEGNTMQVTQDYTAYIGEF
ncbi:Fungal transcriptional regulatory [Cordyceps militaris]|uniref:Fungal transcriptional regulatory n=1 Tax=Cordyceps militaris TaxID=73501 RepID=A0A2H4SR79_CORMI|nr:Fungal transcriptional regulatory [Cordyceps militaris]